MLTPARILNLRSFIRGFAALLALSLGGIVSFGLAPEPDVVPRRWQLQIEPGPLRITSIDTPGIGPRAYFYFTYKVTNTSPGDLLFAPIFDLTSDEGDISRGGRDVPADVTRQIWASLENPSLQDQIGIVGTLLTGEENAKEGLVIWPAANLHPGEISIYAAGFSGETKIVPVIDPKTKQPSTATLRKTLMLRYQTEGELRDLSAKPLALIEQRWIMR